MINLSHRVRIFRPQYCNANFYLLMHFFCLHLGEAERITLCKGRVFALHNEPDVTRVWLPNSNSPGLAMARAFGDFCLKDYGLISVPDVSYRRLTEKDEFVVLATDGVRDQSAYIIFTCNLFITTQFYLHIWLLYDLHGKL